MTAVKKKANFNFKLSELEEKKSEPAEVTLLVPKKAESTTSNESYTGRLSVDGTLTFDNRIFDQASSGGRSYAPISEAGSEAAPSVESATSGMATVTLDEKGAHIGGHWHGPVWRGVQGVSPRVAAHHGGQANSVVGGSSRGL